jgi:hypothetical protein
MYSTKLNKPKITWSYSSLSLFLQCAFKYYRIRVLKDIKDSGSEATIYGQEMHKVAEEYVRDGTPIPDKFDFIKPSMAVVSAWKGKKLCEYKLGLREDLTPCDFFAKDVWWRGIADLIVISEDGASARVIDYKSSKSSKYADMKQLDLLAAAVFIHFPKVTKIKAALMFLVCDEMVPPKPKEYEFMFRTATFENVKHETKRIEIAQDTGVWNKVKNFTCKGWCPVRDCPNWEERR